MNFAQLKPILILGIGVILAICFGYSVSVEDYTSLIVVAASTILLVLFLFVDFIPILALGLMTPFCLPIPFIDRFPFLTFVLLFCIVKYLVVRGLTLHREHLKPLNILTSGIIAFMLLVALHYCTKPAIPHMAGVGDSISGFRAYLSYVNAFALFLFMSYVIRTRQEVIRLIKSILFITVGYTLILGVASLNISSSLYLYMRLLGMSGGEYDTGSMRFLAMSNYGIILIMCSLFARPLSIGRTGKVFLFVMGVAAVILGGGRGILVISLFIIIFSFLLKKRFLLAAVCGVVLLALGLGINVFGKQYQGKIGVLRSLTAFSSKMAENTESADSMNYRLRRWTRAWTDIQEKPIWGWGYGGLENAFIWVNSTERDEASIEIDMETGGAHCGYLACARALGMPASFLFIGIIISHLCLHFKHSRRFLKSDLANTDLHGLVLSGLAASFISLIWGSDVNDIWSWFYLGLGMVVLRIIQAEEEAQNAQMSNATSLALQPT